MTAMTVTFASVVTCVAAVQAAGLFKKYTNRKLTAPDVTSTHFVAGVLQCEQLCLGLGDGCQIVNVIKRRAGYECDVIGGPLADASDVDKLAQSNPGGKLIVKQDPDDSCSEKPCQNGGECVDIGSTYRCYCAPDFVGRNCHIPISSDVSINLNLLPRTLCTSDCGGICDAVLRGASYCETDEATVCPASFINITFPEPVDLEEVSIDQGCDSFFSNYEAFTLTFSDQSSLEVTGSCGSTTTTFSTSKVTRWILVKGAEECPFLMKLDNGIVSVKCYGKPLNT